MAAARTPEALELKECDQCDGLYVAYTPDHSIEDTRLLLYRRCIDAGWSEAKTTRYLNRVLPLVQA